MRHSQGPERKWDLCIKIFLPRRRKQKFILRNIHDFSVVWTERANEDSKILLWSSDGERSHV